MKNLIELRWGIFQGDIPRHLFADDTGLLANSETLLNFLHFPVIEELRILRKTPYNIKIR